MKLRQINTPQLLSRIGMLGLCVASLSMADVLDDIKPGEWHEVPNSKLSSIKPNPLPVGNSGFEAVMSAWSGGSYDTRRDRLIIWGGGHQDYSGNEIYAFDVNTLKWSRISEPTSNVGGDENSGVYPDGSPRSRHTYNYVQYVPSIDAFCTFGGTAMYPSGAKGTEKTHCFDFATSQWELKADAPGAGIGSVSGVDPETGLTWIQIGGQNGGFAQWDAVNNAWKEQSTYIKGWFDYYSTAAVGKGKFLALGDKKLIQWDLKTPAKAAAELSTGGENGILEADNPGFVYDTKRGIFIAWNGGADVYALDLAARSWTKVPIASTNQVIPTAAQTAGTYGRFQYIPSKDLYIGVNRTSENVYFFRLPDGLSFPPVDVKKKTMKPATGKVEFNLHDGFATRSFSESFVLPQGSLTAEGLSCRIFSAQREILRAEGSPSSSGQFIFRATGPATSLSTMPAGAYFMRIQSGNQVLLSRPLGFIR